MTVEKINVDRRLPEGKQLRRLLSIHRANERGYHTQEESLTAEYPGQWIATYDRGRKYEVGTNRAELLRSLTIKGLTTGTEFITAIPYFPL